MTLRDPFLVDLWRFLGGDTEPGDFEQWIYAHIDEWDVRLGTRSALDVIATDFRSPDAVSDVRRILREYAERVSDLACRCMTVPNVAVLGMGEESERVLGTIERRRARGNPFWWLWCGECIHCGQWWLIAQEERQNDVFCLRRLGDAEVRLLQENDIWPADFDSYETLLRLALKAGWSVRFADPENAKSLRWTIADLAKARPGLKVSDLAQLLNLDIDLARILAERAVREDGAVIVFD